MCRLITCARSVKMLSLWQFSRLLPPSCRPRQGEPQRFNDVAVVLLFYTVCSLCWTERSRVFFLSVLSACDSFVLCKLLLFVSKYGSCNPFFVAEIHMLFISFIHRLSLSVPLFLSLSVMCGQCYAPYVYLWYSRTSWYVLCGKEG